MGFAFAKALKATEGLKRDIRRFLDGVEESIGEIEKRIAKEAAERLIAYSPVWTGSYVESFRVGINSIDPSFTKKRSWLDFVPDTPDLPQFQPRVNFAEAEQIKIKALAGMLAKIMVIRPFDVVNITNSVPHAVNVEYTGWPDYGRPPYEVFMKAEADLWALVGNGNNLLKSGGLK